MTEQELNNITAEIERQHDDTKARKISVLRSTMLKQRAKKVWSDAKKKFKMFSKMGTMKNVTVNQKSAAELKAEAKQRHEREEARLAKALEDQATAAKAAKALELSLAHDKEAAALQEHFLGKLDAASSEEERKRLLDHHGAQMQELQRRQVRLHPLPAKAGKDDDLRDSPCIRSFACATLTAMLTL